MNSEMGMKKDKEGVFMKGFIEVTLIRRNGEEQQVLLNVSDIALLQGEGTGAIIELMRSVLGRHLYVIHVAESYNKMLTLIAAAQ